MEKFNLIEKSKKYQNSALAFARKNNLTQQNGKFSKGDVIEFWAGYNDDIRFIAEIIGFEGENIFLLWDCYWSPIKDDNRRKIEKVFI